MIMNKHKIEIELYPFQIMIGKGINNFDNSIFNNCSKGKWSNNLRQINGNYNKYYTIDNTSNLIRWYDNKLH